MRVHHITIPKESHKIWIGSEISNRDAKFINNEIENNSNYKFYLWYDSKLIGKDIVKKMREKLNKDVRLMDVQPLQEEKYDDLFNIYDELIAPPDANYGAASDILRIIILLIKGGLYLDTDEKIIGKLPDIQVDADEGFGMDRSRREGIIIGSGRFPFYNNCIMASIPQSKFLTRVTKKIVELYNLYDSQLKARIKKGCRFDTTLITTGPLMLASIMMHENPNEFRESKLGLGPLPIETHIYSTQNSTLFATGNQRWADEGPICFETCNTETIPYLAELALRILIKLKTNNFIEQVIDHLPEHFDDLKRNLRETINAMRQFTDENCFITAYVGLENDVLCVAQILFLNKMKQLTAPIYEKIKIIDNPNSFSDFFKALCCYESLYSSSLDSNIDILESISKQLKQDSSSNYSLTGHEIRS